MSMLVCACVYSYGCVCMCVCGGEVFVSVCATERSIFSAMSLRGKETHAAPLVTLKMAPYITTAIPLTHQNNLWPVTKILNFQ